MGHENKHQSELTSAESGNVPLQPRSIDGLQLSDIASWLQNQSQRLLHSPVPVTKKLNDPFASLLHDSRQRLAAQFSEIRTQVSTTYSEFAAAIDSTQQMLDALKSELESSAAGCGELIDSGESCPGVE